MAAIDLTQPADAEIEVSVFGPDYGECIVLHLGNGEWLVNDSYVPSGSRQPVALTYLRSLGVPVESAVKLIVASHWHDDHIRGLASMVEACPAARFVCSAALGKEEFLRLVDVASMDPTSLRSGVAELKRIIELLRERPHQGLEFAIADRMLWRNRQSTVSAHALAPSSASVAAALSDIAMLIPEIATKRLRAPANSINGSSVVLLVNFDDDAVLLGGDLETHANPRRGWQAILDSPTRPPGRASVYKVAHHGSITAHMDEIWAQILSDESTSVITPWRRGRYALPTEGDVSRISALSGQTYITATKSPQRRKRDRLVAEEMRKATRSFAPIDGPIGHVRLRRQVGAAQWSVELTSSAVAFPRQRVYEDDAADVTIGSPTAAS